MSKRIQVSGARRFSLVLLALLGLPKGGSKIRQLNVRSIDKICAALRLQPGDLFE